MIADVIKIRLEDRLTTAGADGKPKSLYSLAQETGISYNALWKISKGKVQGITFDVLEKLCLALDCKPSDLLEIQVETK